MKNTTKSLDKKKLVNSIKKKLLRKKRTDINELVERIYKSEEEDFWKARRDRPKCTQEEIIKEINEIEKNLKTKIRTEMYQKRILLCAVKKSFLIV